MKITVLGSGTSTGVPVIGCDCRVCRSQDPKNKRSRASLLVQHSAGNILIDTAPELRNQILATGISSLSAVLYTHLHADHTAGFDDLRAFWFYSKSKLRLYLLPEYHEEFRQRFRYAFVDTGYKGAKPQVELVAIDQPFAIDGLAIEYAVLAHGNVNSCAFRIGKFAYATDFKCFSPEQIDNWRGKIEVMVASGIHWGKHYTHSVIPETLELFDQLQVKHGIISHLAHDVEYLSDTAKLPEGRELAYDGMVVDLQDSLA